MLKLRLPLSLLFLMLLNIHKIINIIIIRLEMFDDDHLDPSEMLFKTLCSKNKDLQTTNRTEGGENYHPKDLPWHVGTSNPRSLTQTLILTL